MMNMTFYPAYAYHQFVSIDDIMLDKPFYTFEEADEYAEGWLCDDDDCGVFTVINGEWHAVACRDKETGMLVVNKGPIYDRRNSFLYKDK